MPDNIRITTPIPLQEGIGRISQLKNPGAMQGVDASKVAQSNTGTMGQNEGFEFLLSRNSVFSKFIEQLAQTPELSQNMKKIVLDLFGKTESARTENLSATMTQLADTMKMEPEDMLTNLEFLGANQTKFSGKAFDTLRELLAQFPTDAAKEKLAEFLKAYDGFFSIGSTTEAIARELNIMRQQVPMPYSGQLQELTNQLVTDHPVENMNQNLTLLKEKIIPFLSSYVSTTNDFGRVRDNITLLVHDLAQLNISSRDELSEKFHSLLDYLRFDLNFSAAKTENIKALFIEHLNQSPEKPQNAFFESLVRALAEGSQHSPSQLSQSLYKDAVSSMLLDNSVYMPFQHMFLPVNYHGQFMFSEIWIEKDDNAEKKTGYTADAGKTTRMHLTFDIKSLGYFEATIELNQKKAQVRLNCPAELSADTKRISDNITEIFARNGLDADRVDITTGKSPTVSQQILNKIYERKNIVDVTI